jgi:uncharacterized protein YegJ (DUF2314 family)
MNRSGISAWLVGLLVASVIGCSERDMIVDVAADDPEMNAAIAKARATLPTFWQVFERRERGDSDFSLKVKVTDPRVTEYFWVTDIARLDGKIMGTIDNDAMIVASVKLGDRIEISDADISDWLYMRKGKMVGNHTVRPLFKKMPASEVERMKHMLADP